MTSPPSSSSSSSSDARSQDVPDPVIDRATAAVHAGEYRLLASIEAGMADGYERHRMDVGDHRSLLFRSLDLASVGARRRAGHYAGLARALQAYADAPPADPDPVLGLGAVTLDLSDAHDGGHDGGSGGPRT